MDELIYVEKTYALNQYAVVFTDSNGVSILARVKTRKEADQRAKWYRKVRAAGVTLLEDTSVYD